MKTTRTTYREGGYDPTKPGSNIASQTTRVQRGLGTDRPIIPPDGTTPATLHYAGDQQSVAWNINGLVSTEAATLDATTGLWVSELEVVSIDVGEVTVIANGERVVLEVRA